MVKVSGISQKHLKNPDGKFDIEMLKTIYNPNNCIMVLNCRPMNRRNKFYQTVIDKTHYKFAFEDSYAPTTHILENGIITKISTDE